MSFTIPSDWTKRGTPPTEQELATLRAEMMVPGEVEEFTCDTCPARSNCEFVYDWYNTDGDCLAEK